MAAVIHDLGKINVPAEILSKPGKLTENEFGIIKTHPRIGYDILKGIEFSWHQDSGQLNADLETSPRPRISLKVGYFLTDTRETGRGNLYVIPGSHLLNEFPGPDRRAEAAEGVPVRVAPGTAVFFVRRLWHSGSHNYWNEPRRVLFYGYSYRWLRPRDDMQVAHYLPHCDPIRRQLLGVSHSGGRGYTSPTEEDVPLRAWLAEHLGEAALAP